LLQEAEANFSEGTHLLLHRFGVLGYAPAVWGLLPLLLARMPLMSPKQVALSCWALGRTLVNDEEAWAAIGKSVRSRIAEFALTDLAMVAWAFAAIDRVSPLEVVMLKKAVREKLVGQSTKRTSSHDLCMLFKAIARLTPQDNRFLHWLFLLMLEGMANKTMNFTAQGLTCIWGTLAALQWRIDQEELELICEESRFLRLDHTFNQDMAAELAHSLLKLGVKDPRPEYQIVDFVARRGLTLRADALLATAEFFAARGVTHEIAWKRVGVRAQQRGIDLRLADIDRLVAAFRSAGRGNQRIYGMLQLFTRIREDQAKCGAA